jgi:hypothetical protein
VFCGTSNRSSSTLGRAAGRHLKAQADALSRGELELKRLIARAAEMCASCRLLMIGISSDADLPELVRRINNDIQQLRHVA